MSTLHHCHHPSLFLIEYGQVHQFVHSSKLRLHGRTWIFYYQLQPTINPLKIGVEFKAKLDFGKRGLWWNQYVINEKEDLIGHDLSSCNQGAKPLKITSTRKEFMQRGMMIIFPIASCAHFQGRNKTMSQMKYSPILAT